MGRRRGQVLKQLLLAIVCTSGGFLSDVHRNAFVVESELRAGKDDLRHPGLGEG